MAITSAQLASIAESDGNVVSARGQKIGGIGQVYVDDVTGEPTWVTATMGLFGRSESFVPLRDANVSGNDVVVSYDKETVKEAPRVDADDNVTPEEEQTLYSYYGLPSSGAPIADRIEREPNTDANVVDPTAGPDISGEQHEVALPEELVVEKAAGAVEGVRPGTETVPDEALGSEDARKERIDTDVANEAPAVTDHS